MSPTHEDLMANMKLKYPSFEALDIKFKVTQHGAEFI